VVGNVYSDNLFETFRCPRLYDTYLDLNRVLLKDVVVDVENCSSCSSSNSDGKWLRIYGPKSRIIVRCQMSAPMKSPSITPSRCIRNCGREAPPPPPVGVSHSTAKSCTEACMPQHTVALISTISSILLMPGSTCAAAKYVNPPIRIKQLRNGTFSSKLCMNGWP
jgi:hypothetical protein